MEVRSQKFKRAARAALKDTRLQAALARLQTRFVEERSKGISDLDDFEGQRAAATAIREHTLQYLDLYLERFEAAVIAAGGVVYWAKDAAQAQALVVEIAARHGVRKAAKSKSMVSEECALNEALERAGVAVMETDLGEYILQLAKDRPSHIVAPVMHKHKEEISALFAQKHARPPQTEIAALTAEARGQLRSAFLSADMGITGANFLIAENGAGVLVTNEGNGRLVTTLPKVHVALTGIEKIVPTLEDVSVLLRLLPRSATGQTITNYVTLFSGPRRTGDPDGPEHFYVILLDNGRAALLGSELQSILRCIRCGACMNHCPVYQNVGGHAYGWVYPGPMGAILTPLFAGLEHTVDLPNASTFCGACAAVCPVGIPLPDLLRHLRSRQVRGGLRGWRERWLMRLWLQVALRPRAYRLVAGTLARVLHWWGGRTGLLRRLPFASGWTGGRDLPAPAGATFHALYRRRCRE